jgi:hypothetical protein
LKGVVKVFENTTDYFEVIEFLSSQFRELNGYDFYKEIFPNCEDEGEFNTNYSKPNAIYLYMDKEKGKKRRRIMLQDKWEHDYIEYVEENEGTLCGGLTYRGCANKLMNAQQMNALIIDLDGVGLYEIRNLFAFFNVPSDNTYACPMPTYIIASGTGLHLYYVFDEPIDLFPNIKLQMKSLKYALTFKVWLYKDTSKYKKVQYQSINQGFRMVGSTNDKYGLPLRAFQTGEKVSILDLNRYVKEQDRVDLQKRFRPSKMTKEQAREQFPEWYQRVVVEGNRRQKKWDIAGQKGHNGDELYLWWLNRAGEVRGGHRYFFLMCLVIYACKCDIPKKRLKEDMQTAFVELSKVGHTNPLTQEDITSALEIYSKEYYNFTIADIEKLTDLRIIRNKRNYRTQRTHLRLARATKEILKEEKQMKPEGRPKGSGEKREIVKEWRQQHLEGTKAECNRDTGLDPKTIRKWWND